MAKLGGHSPERGKTVAALGKIRREGEASSGRRRRYGRGNGGEGGGAREGGRSGVSDEGVDAWRVDCVFGASSVGGAAEREKGEERWGLAVGVPHGASLFGQRRAGIDVGGPRWQCERGGSGEVRVAHGHAWAGPRTKGVVEPG
jgi:hypothetical protein